MKSGPVDCICNDGVWFYINKCPVCQVERQCHSSVPRMVQSHCPVHWRTMNYQSTPPRNRYHNLCASCSKAKVPTADEMQELSRDVLTEMGYSPGGNSVWKTENK